MTPAITHLILFVGVAIFVIYGIPRLFNFGEKEIKQEMQDATIKMFGGPLDNKTEVVPYQKDESVPPFFIAPYSPELDEEGNPPQENVVGWMRGKVYIRPNYAYYQQMTDEDYFYVRDLKEEEVVKIQQTGELPTVQPKEDEDAN